MREHTDSDVIVNEEIIRAMVPINTDAVIAYLRQCGVKVE